jgi:nucleoside-diphosphate-sugar epimerase
VHDTLREDVPQRGCESWINYERSKFAAEAAVRASGIPFIVFQPAHILGPGDTHNWSRLFVLVDQGKLPGVPPGSGSFADVREIARAQVRGWREGRFGESFPARRRARQLPRTDHARGRGAGPADAQARDAAVGAARVCAGDGGGCRAQRARTEAHAEAAEFTAHHLRVDSGKAMRELGYPRNAAAGTARRHAGVDAQRGNVEKIGSDSLFRLGECGPE